MLYEELGNVEKEKKVYKATIQSKGGVTLTSDCYIKR